MSSQPSKADFHERLLNINATDGWDVMVAYAEGPLNRLLQDNWAKSTAFTNVNFTQNVPLSADLSNERKFSLSLAPPSLQFEATDLLSRATLMMDISGSCKSTTTLKGKPIEPPTTDIIAKNAYQLRVYVPVVGITGNKVHETSEVIEFDDKDKTEETSLIFHFKSEQAKWSVEKKDDKKRAQDALMPTIIGEIQAWLSSTDNVNWIDFSLAKVSNKKPLEGDTDTLRPRSFTMSTQPGYLNVFIATKNNPGKVPPQFQYNENETMAPVPVGFEAGIFISKNLFTSFLSDQLKASFSYSITSIVPEATKDGMSLSIKMGAALPWNVGNLDGLQKYTISPFSVDTSKYAVTLDLEDDSSFATIPTWTWDPQTTATWYLDEDTAEIPEYHWGKTQISGKLSKTGTSCSSIVGDELQISVALDSKTDLPTMSYKGLAVGDDHQYVGTTDIPPVLEDKTKVQIALPSSLTAQLKGLNFFSAQNVFVPGVRFIQATTQMMPSDVVLLGSMPRDSSKGSKDTMASFSSLTLEEPSDSVISFVDEIYHNAHFLGDLISHAANGDGKGIKDMVVKKGYRFSEKDLDSLHELVKPGPEFDVRYAGGAYKVESSGYPVQELLVHSVHRTIYIDGTPVESQKTLSDGSVTFESSDGQQSFHITFDVQLDPEGQSGGQSFQGTTWPTAHADQKVAINGGRYFPWDDTPEKDAAPVDSARDTEALRFLPFALDLTTAPMSTKPESLPEGAGASIAAIGGLLGIVTNVINLDKNLVEAFVRYKGYYRSIKGVVLKKADKKIRNSLKELAVDDLKPLFTDRAVEIINKEINKTHNVDSDGVLQATRNEILDAMRREMRSEGYFKIEKECSAAIALDATETDASVDAGVNDDAAAMFTGDAYDAYVKAIVDRVVASRDKDEAIRGRKLVQRRVNEALERIEIQNREKRKKEQELEEKKREAKEKGTSEKDWKEEQEKYQKEIDEISTNIKADEEKLREDRADKTSQDEEIKRLKGEEENMQKVEQEKAKAFWKDRKKPGKEGH